MTETLHLKDCPVCSSKLSVTFDKIDETVTLRPENLPPLAKDCLDIVAEYKRLKGLGASWQKSHGARGIVYAGQLIQAAGPLGGAQERVLGLLAWLAENKREFDLGTAATHFGEYAAYLAAKQTASKGRCNVCGESYFKNNSFATGDDNCGRHS